MRFFLSLLLALAAGGCGVTSPRFGGRESGETTGQAASPATHRLSGIASYYADEFHGRRTASGEAYDMRALTAAHRTLPFHTRLRVRNLDNGLSVDVRINDRGPFKDDRVIDLSLEAARRVGLIPNGTGPVELQILEADTSSR